MGRDQTKFKAAFKFIKGMGLEILGHDPDIAVFVKDSNKPEELIQGMKNLGWHYQEDSDALEACVYTFSKNSSGVKKKTRDVFPRRAIPGGIAIQKTYLERILWGIFVSGALYLWMTEPFEWIFPLVTIATAFFLYASLIWEVRLEPGAISIRTWRGKKIISSDQIAKIYTSKHWSPASCERVVIELSSGHKIKLEQMHFLGAREIRDEIKAHLK